MSERADEVKIDVDDHTHVTEELKKMAASGATHMNGDSNHGEDVNGHQMVSDDMLFKLSKKIAQLTKVIYSLNTKNDDLEFDMENMRHSYEDKLDKVRRDEIGEQKIILMIGGMASTTN